MDVGCRHHPVKGLDCPPHSQSVCQLQRRAPGCRHPRHQKLRQLALLDAMQEQLAQLARGFGQCFFLQRVLQRSLSAFIGDQRVCPTLE
eukprot:18341-Rhodomonas_salina.2